MKFISLVLFAVLFSCYEIQSSELMIERGVVVDTIHVDSISDIDLSIGFNGQLGVVPSSTPEQWGVVIRCDHGDKFAIQGSTSFYERLWNRLDTGMVVEVHYREEYIVTHDNDGDRREFYDYEFVNAFEVK